MKKINFSGKRVLVRVDFNVPLDDEHNIKDFTRIERALPTLKYILDQGGRLVICTHMGRPKVGEENAHLSTKHLVPDLERLLNRTVVHLDDTVGERVQKKISDLDKESVVILENTRFYNEEKKGDETFAKQLSNLADIYINDAFGTAHRAHASTATVAQYFDDDAKGFGFLMQAEIENGNKILQNPQHPVTCIVGGAKVSDKIKLLENLINLADHILIGGGMAYTFIKAQGGAIGNSLCEDEHLDLAKEILKKSEAKECTIHLPKDSVIADEFSASANTMIVDSHSIQENWMGLDIGPEAIADYKKVLLDSKTILWNGPMGVFEMESFAIGTFQTAQAVADATSNGAFSLIGGGDSVSAINKSGLNNKVSYISTGGGAMLELLEGKKLPGIAAITD